SGANGFVGTSLTNFYSSFGYKIVPISRDILNNKSKLEEVLNTADIVINLAGANIINRWRDSYKKLL
ncbi:epimerase, partial [Aliarcobacter butzleri]